MNQTNRQERARKKAKQNRVMRNPLGSSQQDVIALLKKTLRKRIRKGKAFLIDQATDQPV